MDFLVALIPCLAWGAAPVLATLIGGKPIVKTLGLALGSLFFAMVIFMVERPFRGMTDSQITDVVTISLLSGCFWAVGSFGQFQGIQFLGVSKSMPISNGTQIIFTSILGVTLGDWASLDAKYYGFAAIVLIILGIIFTSYTEKKGEGVPLQWMKGITSNLYSSLGFAFYVGILKWQHIDSWQSILPQSVGMLVGTMVIMFFTKEVLVNCLAIKNSFAGLIWASGNLALLISQVRIGLAVAYPISQASVIIALLGGVFVNKETKTSKEWAMAGIGIGIILAGLYFIYLSSVY